MYNADSQAPKLHLYVCITCTVRTIRSQTSVVGTDECICMYHKDYQAAPFVCTPFVPKKNVVVSFFKGSTSSNIYKNMLMFMTQVSSAWSPAHGSRWSRHGRGGCGSVSTQRRRGRKEYRKNRITEIKLPWMIKTEFRVYIFLFMSLSNSSLLLILCS